MFFLWLDVGKWHYKSCCRSHLDSFPVLFIVGSYKLISVSLMWSCSSKVSIKMQSDSLFWREPSFLARWDCIEHVTGGLHLRSYKNRKIHTLPPLPQFEINQQDGFQWQQLCQSSTYSAQGTTNSVFRSCAELQSWKFFRSGLTCIFSQRLLIIRESGERVMLKVFSRGMYLDLVLNFIYYGVFPRCWNWLIYLFVDYVYFLAMYCEVMLEIFSAFALFFIARIHPSESKCFLIGKIHLKVYIGEDLKCR